MPLWSGRLGFLYAFPTCVDYFLRRLRHKGEVHVFLRTTDRGIDSEVRATDMGDFNYIEVQSLGHQYDGSLRRRSGIGGEDSPKEQNVVFVDEHIGEERKICGQGV